MSSSRIVCVIFLITPTMIPSCFLILTSLPMPSFWASGDIFTRYVYASSTLIMSPNTIVSPVHHLMKMLGALINLDPVRPAEIIKHAIKKFVLTPPDQRSFMRAHQDIWIIASYHALSPDDIRDFINHAFLIDPSWKFHPRRESAAHSHIKKCNLVSEPAVVVQYRLRFLASP